MAARSGSKAAYSGNSGEGQVEVSHDLTSVNASQDELATAVAKMLEMNNRKRAAKRQQFERDIRSLFDNHCKELQALHEESQHKLNDLRRSNLSKLSSFLQSRSEIESEIVTTTKTLLNAYAATSHETRLVLEERIAELVKTRDTTKG